MLFSKLSMFQRALDATNLRHKVISNNIANAETPNYKSQRVIFEEELATALASSSKLKAYRNHDKHISFSTQTQPFPRIVTDTDKFMNNDGNNVDLDFEMAELAKNQLHHEALVLRTQGFFNSLQTVIKPR